MTDHTALTRNAEAAHEAIREMAYLTAHTATPAPVLYEILGSLAMAGHALPQVLAQLADGLAKSLDTYDVYDDNGADPAATAARAQQYLSEAAGLATRLGMLLEEAQNAITHQGYRDPDTPASH